jgi:cell fate (sporulation/competence/biofilm development) regulator YmcA (YheA/YmcA/DUF963 family)
MNEWVLSGGIVAIIGLILTIMKTQDVKMSKACEEQEQRITRVWQRIDEVKEYQDKTFTRQDMCNLTHKQVTETLQRMEQKLDKILNSHE